MKIAMIGTHGVGKTTLCFELAARVKRRGFDVELVREVARKCPLPINEDTTAEAQSWILHTQVAEELAASATHEIVIADRAVLDNYCYMVHASCSSKHWELFLDTWLPSYDFLIHVPLWSRPSFDGVRAIDPRFQQEIDDILQGMIKARGISTVDLSADDPSRWGAEIEETILEFLDPNLPLFDEIESS